MYAPKNNARITTTNLTAVSQKVTRLVLDEELAAKASTTHQNTYTCRCSESKNDPSILCPSHWLSMQFQLPDAVH